MISILSAQVASLTAFFTGESATYEQIVPLVYVWTARRRLPTVLLITESSIMMITQSLVPSLYWHLSSRLHWIWHYHGSRTVELYWSMNWYFEFWLEWLVSMRLLARSYFHCRPACYDFEAFSITWAWARRCRTPSIWDPSQLPCILARVAF